MGFGKWFGTGGTRFARWATRNPATIDEVVESMERAAKRMPSRRASFMSFTYLRQAENRLTAGQFADALTAVDQAIAQGGQRVGRWWLNVEQNVGAALGVRSTILEKLERPEDSVASAEAAAEHMRQLIEQDPPRFQPLYAGQLTALADLLGRLGRTEEATAKAEHALTVLHGLSGDQDARLASTLHVLWRQLREAERYQDALPVIAEEVEVCRRIYGSTPTPVFADKLRIYGAVLRLVGRTEEALRAVDESIAMWDRLVSREPGQHDEGAAIALSVRASCVEDLAG